MTVPLATVDDVADLWRPITDAAEVGRVERLLEMASGLLRQVQRRVDERIALFATDPAAVAALAPDVVATVVATMVKRFLSNVSGASSETVGPYSVTYTGRGENTVRGELQVTESDLLALRAPVASSVGSIRVRPALAPWPVTRWEYDAVLASEWVEV